MTWRPKSIFGVQGSQYLRSLLWAAILGLASSLACVAVRLIFLLLQRIFIGHSGLLSDAAEHLPLWRRAITPPIGALFAMAVIWATKHLANKRRFEEYVEAVRLNDGQISFGPTLWRTIASSFSVATGAAIGREGSMIQFATAATSYLGRRIKFSRLPLATQVACGVASAVATAYQAPLAGVFFASEIVVGRTAMSEVPLFLVSALVGSLTGRYILSSGPLFAVHAHLGIDIHHILLALLMAALIGALGPAYDLLIGMLRSTAKWPLPLLWSGVLVGLLSLHSIQVWGNGDAALLSIMQASPAASTLLSVLALRLCATAFCVGTGTVGGVFTPTLFTGSAIGLLAVHLIHTSDPLLFAIVGMGCLMAAVTHAPLMATLMTVELTGQWRLLPLVLLCNATAWAVARSISPNSLYAVATPEPADKLLEPDLCATEVRQKAISQGVAKDALEVEDALEVVEAGQSSL
jgi:CIC family chloride channel protein